MKDLPEEKVLPDGIMKLSRTMCGCGEPDLAWQWILDFLKRKNDKEGNWYWAPDSGGDLIAIYLMDHLGLTEHGTSVNGGWLTSEGEKALAFLVEHGIRWQDDKNIWWVGSDGVSYSNF